MALVATALALSNPHFEVASVKANRSGPTADVIVIDRIDHPAAD